jgi:prepilin-type N-terminal cleavage/methylation domain-containing protein
MKRFASTCGFTLLELLITVSLVAGIVTVVLACFAGGLRVYERVRDSGTRSAEVYLAGESWSQDLSAIIPGGEHVFLHDNMQFFLYSRLDNTLREIEYQAPAVGGLFYASFESGESVTPSVVEMIAPEMEVSFWYRDPDNPSIWLTQWDQATNLPHAVQMRVMGEDEEIVERTFVFVHMTTGEGGASVEGTR